mmetsp:Transcript_14979/g.46867  ORF Transcript_14979/g.46867 Transcript_14979/m.46867 type:complete len:220 (-) Transcript_14979:342-1001(-)
MRTHGLRHLAVFRWSRSSGWQRRSQAWPHSIMASQARSHPPSMGTSDGSVTRVSSPCVSQRSVSDGCTAPCLSRVSRTLWHRPALLVRLSVVADPRMIMPWRARDSMTLTRLVTLRKPARPSSLLRTVEMRTMSASSPWKLSTVASRTRVAAAVFTSVGRPPSSPSSGSSPSFSSRSTSRSSSTTVSRRCFSKSRIVSSCPTYGVRMAISVGRYPWRTK